MMIREPVLLAAALVAALACRSSPPVKPAPGVRDGSAPVARIGRETVTLAELDALASKDLSKLEQQYLERRYQLRRGALEAALHERAFAEEAKARGTTVDALQKELVAKLAPPTEDEIRTIYGAARSAGQQLPPLDEARPQIAAFLETQKRQDADRARYERLQREMGIEVLLPPYEPPRVTVDATGPATGPEDSPVTIVEFADYECPYCVLAQKTVAEVLASYPGKIRLVYRDFPLPMHPKAPKSAEAAHCAADQGKYWEMHDRLFAAGSGLELADLKAHARAIGLDGARFDRCLDEGAKTQLVEMHRKAGVELGVQGTPAFFINGRLLSGSQPIDAFKRVIDQELAAR
jgi:protein-disulfide isomerase